MLKLWTERFDHYFKTLDQLNYNAPFENPIGILTIEWDPSGSSHSSINAQNTEIPETIQIQFTAESYDSLEQATEESSQYTGLSDLVIHEDYFFNLNTQQAISSHESFLELCQALLSLESFKKLKTYKTLFFKYQEHDTEVNFHAMFFNEDGIDFKKRIDPTLALFKSSNPYREIKKIWDRIEKWLEIHYPILLKDLSPGLSMKEIQSIEKDLNTKLPDDYKASLLIHDGQKMTFGFCGLIGNWQLMPYDFCDMNRWRWHYETPLFESIFSDEKIQAQWWNMKWLPLTTNFYDSTDYPKDIAKNICLDLDPSPSGHYGQLFLFSYSDEKRTLIANNYTQWLQIIVEKMESGAYTVSDMGEYGLFNDEGFLNL